MRDNDKSLLERAQFAVSKSKEHQDHWTEPQSLTRGRLVEEKFCEACGVEVPWHDQNCSFMRRAAQGSESSSKE